MAAVSGHLQVVERAGGRVWVALWRAGEGRHKKALGPAWVKPHGKTAKGAAKWRAAGGPKPDGHLTPREAEAAPARRLAAAPSAPTRASALHTFGEACSKWLRYVEHDRARRPSTVGDYRNTVQ